MLCEFLSELLAQGRDPLAEATNGAFHWNDPGMDEFRKGWEEFGLGMRVEVLTIKGWLAGTIRETPHEGRFFDIECDRKWHEVTEHYDGKGVYLPLYLYNTRRELWSLMRTIPDPVENFN